MGLTPRHRDGVSRRGRRTDRSDDGSVLILTLLLTVVLATMVLALATYAASGLTTSGVTTERTESNAAASSGLSYVIEELAKKQIAPDSDCDASIPIPAGLVSSSGATVSVECTTQVEIDNHPTLLLTATAVTADGTTRVIEAIVQVPRDQYTVQVHSWSAE